VPDDVPDEVPDDVPDDVPDLLALALGAGDVASSSDEGGVVAEVGPACGATAAVVAAPALLVLVR
jgi:hypothetical protein